MSCKITFFLLQNINNWFSDLGVKIKKLRISHVPGILYAYVRKNTFLNYSVLLSIFYPIISYLSIIFTLLCTRMKSIQYLSIPSGNMYLTTFFKFMAIYLLKEYIIYWKFLWIFLYTLKYIKSFQILPNLLKSLEILP